MADQPTANDGFTLFGFEIKRKGNDKKDKKEEKLVSFVAPNENDAVDRVINVGGYFGHYVDIDGFGGQDERETIYRYRDVAYQPECDTAVEEITDEAIVSTEGGVPVSINVDDLDQPDKIKKAIREEFESILEMLNFSWNGHEIFRRWYIDGRLYYHKIVDENNLKRGILELRNIDPVHMKKVREIKREEDPKTKVQKVTEVNEYFVYQNDTLVKSGQGVKISKDAITYVTSGITDPSQKRVLSHLHKALKPVNNLRMMEDSLVIYRLARAPERRVFYIDVGNLTTSKAEQYMKSIMAKHKNKIVYDAKTGEMRDEKKHMSMLEDFWLPRREGGRGTEVTTLSGGENLSSIEDIVFFQRKLYKSLNVPLSRLEEQDRFSLGRASEITREELKFHKFIARLRKKFSHLFLDILKTQLILKSIINEDDWADISQKIYIDYQRDNHFYELKNIEVLQDRIRMAQDLEQYVGRFYSNKWIRKNILMQDEEEIEAMDKEIKEEGSDAQVDDGGLGF